MKRLFATLVLAGLVGPVYADKVTLPGYVISTSELSTEIRGNEAYPTKMNGLFSLFSVFRPGVETCEPTSSRSCFDYEHVISAYQDVRNLFEPRSGLLVLSVLAPHKSVRLTRRAQDDAWGVGAVIDFTAVDPHYVDMSGSFTVSNAAVFGAARQMTLMFASYMKLTDEIGFHMRGIAGPGQPEQWLYLDAPCCPVFYNQGGSYRFQGSSPSFIGPNNDSAFNLISYDWPLATQPFYCGIAENGMLHEVMFDQMWSPAQEMRATLYKFRSKFGENKPAWDFQFVVHPVESGHTYNFKVRYIRKPFVSLDDCKSESDRWQAERPV
jgi:hypothetical protein